MKYREHKRKAFAERPDVKREYEKLGEPLTIEELRGMDGKPVWLSVAGGVWGIVCVSDGCVVVRPSQEIDIVVLGGLAYRYPPVATDTNVGGKDINVSTSINLDAWEPCEYCNGERMPYQHTRSTKLFIDTFGSARTLVTECNGCPPYAKCCMKDISVNSAFPINFCPNCGRPLTDEARDMLEKRLRGCVE